MIRTHKLYPAADAKKGAQVIGRCCSGSARPVAKAAAGDGRPPTAPAASGATAPLSAVVRAGASRAKGIPGSSAGLVRRALTAKRSNPSTRRLIDAGQPEHEGKSEQNGNGT